MGTLSMVFRRFVVITLLVVTSWLFCEKPAQAQAVSGGEAAAIFTVIAAIGAVVGVTIYYVARKNPSITGCVASGSDGLRLENESDHQVFLLSGDTTELKAGERVKVSGKKKKLGGGGRSFIVEKTRKDYGSCRASVAAGTP